MKINNFNIALKAYDRETGTPINIETEYLSEEILTFSLSVDFENPSSALAEIELLNEENLFHLIPCNIHGNNNLENAKPGFFPNLTYSHNEHETSSDVWEFKADRASHPVSIITCDNGAVGISIDPYSDSIKNGLFSQLPNIAGVSLGYMNRPVTFTSKENMTVSTSHKIQHATVKGKIFAIKGNKRLAAHKIIEHIYYENHHEISFDNSYKTYLREFLDSYEHINWSNEMNGFTNMKCKLPVDNILKPWRPLIATGWTGTTVLCYPLLAAQKILNQNNSFTSILISQLDQMSERINPKTGLFYDLIRSHNGSDVNGWWAGYLVKDCHCAYTNGNGIYYLLKTYLLLDEKNKNWLKSSLTALDSIVKMQKEDGNFGYTYSIDKLAIEDEQGFAGCWFVGALALAYKITNNRIYLDSAKKGIEFYSTFVNDLNCYGTPMDTFKSVDQEGNLAYIRSCRVLHEITNDTRYLTLMENGANYEYLWRYSYKAKAEYAPLKDSTWDSTGGSVTSVSNPHIHPMGVNVSEDLMYLYKKTLNKYHLHRAIDGLNWGLQTADLYPDVTGYGKLGVISERYCPSDGLVVEEYSDTLNKSSIWFTFNGWAGVSILEGLAELILSNDIDI